MSTTGVADYYKRNMNDGKLSLHGYLFDFYNNVNSVDKRSPFVGLYETLFLEQKGSVKNYIRDKNEWLVAESSAVSTAFFHSCSVQ